MKIQDFTGGLATKRRPQYLQLNEAAEYTNVDNTKGSLVPLMDSAVTEITTGRYNYFFEPTETWVSRDIASDFVEFQNDLYISDRVGRMQRFDGTDEFDVGLDIPAQLDDFTPIIHPEPPIASTFATAVNATGLPEEDTYYALFNVDAADKFSNGLIIKINVDGTASTFSANTTDLPYPTVINSNPSGDKREIDISGVTGITYGTLGVYIYRLYNGNYRLVGTLADDTDSFLDDTYVTAGAIIDEDSIGVLTGTVQYSISYYDSATGVESGLSTPSDEIELERNGSIQIGSLPVSTQAQVDKKRLYRIGGDLVSFSLVVELDNADTTYTDAIPDFRIEADIATSEENNVPLDGSKFLTEHNAMLFAAVGPRLYYTPIGQPENWPRLNFIQYSLDVTGIASVANGLLVFTLNKTYIVTGTGPAVLKNQVLDGTQGCISHDSVQPVGGAAIWASYDGLCTSSGGFVKLLTRERLGKLELSPVDSIVYDEVYYVLNDDGTALVFDYGNNGVFKTLETDLLSFSLAIDTFYGWKDDTLYEFFAGDDFLTMRYLSPRFIEGRATELKTYKKVYIYAKGDIILKILIDDELVQQQSFSSEDGYTVQIPTDKQRGFFIQFDIEGTGEVYELEYVAGPRQND